MPDSNPYKSPSAPETDKRDLSLPNPTYWKLTGLPGLIVVVPWLLAFVQPPGDGSPWMIYLPGEVFALSVVAAMPFSVAVISGNVRVIWYLAHRNG